MPELRFRFEKLGRAAFLSHLDLMRTFQRAFVRAGVRIKHSEGFNPHPRMSFALPLQLGCESICELLDASVLSAPEALCAAMNAALPEGIRVLEVYPPEGRAGAIAYTRWRISFADSAAAAEAAQRLSAPTLVVEKKTKRGTAQLDIAPHLRILRREGDTLELLLSAVEPTVNTGDLSRALLGSGPEAPQPVLCRRTALLTRELAVFR